MKYVPSALGLGQLSRSAGSTTASRNRFGSYVRNRVMPVNPNTASQVTQRMSLQNRSEEWRLLTAAQRAGWDALGAAIVRTDSLGQTYTLTGLQAYTLCNRNLVYIGAAVISAAPALAIPPTLATVTVTATG